MEPKTRKKGENCICGKPLPWHLFALANKRFVHTCSCWRRWRWTSATTATLG